MAAADRQLRIRKFDQLFCAEGVRTGKQVDLKEWQRAQEE